MICRATLILALLPAVAAGQPAVFDPAAAPTPREGFRLLDGRWVRPAGTFAPHEIVDAALVRGRLEVAFAPSADWRTRLRHGRRVVGERSDLPDRPLWHLLVVPGRSLPVAEEATTVVLIAAEDPAPAAANTADVPPRLLAVSFTADDVRLRGVGRFEGATATVEYRAKADGAAPRLTVQLQGKGGLDVNGKDLLELIAANPQAVRQFLRPLLAELSGNDLLRPRPGDFYRAFDAIEPTADELSALAALLPPLNADDPADRDRAARRLDTLGPGGVLAAMRLDYDRLTLEQAARLREYVARHSLGEIDPAVARSDVHFLREAAQDSDPRVREAARERLEELAQ